MWRRWKRPGSSSRTPPSRAPAAADRASASNPRSQFFAPKGTLPWVPFLRLCVARWRDAEDTESMGPYLDTSYTALGYAEDPIPAFLTIEEYIGNVFRPDVDFVDGRTENRNVGEFAHSMVLGQAMYLLGRHEKEWGVEILPTCRLRVSEQRIRVPDVMVIGSNHDREQIVAKTPIVCIEVISPDDTWRRLRTLFT